jgi:GH35 family endo-1,4-beta-xylanase
MNVVCCFERHCRFCVAAFGIWVIACTADAAALTTQEVVQIESELGITVSASDQAALAQIVKPDGPVPQWRIDAEARIEQHRKADVNLQVLDLKGNPVEGAQVRVKLRSNAFRFGGVLTVHDLTDANGNLAAEGSSSDDWKKKVLALFNAAGLNNGFKPKLTGQHAYLPGFMEWAEQNNLPVRGHLLMWPGGGRLSDLDDVNAVAGVDFGNHLSRSSTSDFATHDVLGAVETYRYSGRTQADKDALKAEVDAEIAEWAAWWNVYEWDVINETIGNRLLQEILGYDQMAEWFNIAESNKVDSAAGLFINDFQIISAKHEDGGASYSSRKNTYFNRIDSVISNGGPITGIGFQSRFKFGHISPEMVYQRLDEFSARYPGMDLVGTEFEMKDRFSSNGDLLTYYDEATRAQMTEEILTTYFSHEQVTGLFAWDAFNGTNNPDPAKPEQALCIYNGTVKLNGLAWYYLHRIRYATDESLVTDESGQTSLRGFKGDYDITVSYGGNEYPASLALSSNQTMQVVLSVLVPESYYEEWLADYPELGGNTNVEENLFHYAFGSDPTGAAAGTNWPLHQLRSAGGSNYIDYVYTRRTDASERGLNYYIELGTNLVSGVWTNDTSRYTASGVDADAEWHTVTNRVPMVDDQLFIRPVVEYVP